MLARAEPAGDAALPGASAFDLQGGRRWRRLGRRFRIGRSVPRALPAAGYPDAYLYVVRPVDRGIFRHLRQTEASLAAYREAKPSRARIQAVFALTYLETALLVLVGAVWLGMAAASSIAAPVARLVQAAGRVAGGDLTRAGRRPTTILRRSPSCPAPSTA